MKVSLSIFFILFYCLIPIIYLLVTSYKEIAPMPYNYIVIYCSGFFLLALLEVISQRFMCAYPNQKLKIKLKNETSTVIDNKQKISELEDELIHLTNQINLLEKHAHYLEYHDQLTGLANRIAIKNHLDDLYERSKHTQMEFAFIYVEIDRFKHLNDTLGHLKGDELLKLFSQRLQNLMPDNALVGRQGGDEFIVVIEGLSLSCVSSYLDQIHKNFQHPFKLDGLEIYALPSIGMAMFPHHTNTLSSLVSYSDIAMYAAKEQGGNRVVIYSDDINRFSEENIRLEGKLHKAIENGKIETFYQPQVNALTQKIIGAEALIRWKDEEFGYIPPNKFIPIAEETGLIDQITSIVLEDACYKFAKWNSKLNDPIKVSVNLSAKQFCHPDKLVKQVLDTLDKYCFKPEWLELEITESILMTNTDMTTKALNQLKAKGVQISVDDFGTGYSSLSYLKSLPLDKLKIDQSFIRSIDTELNNKEITLAIITLADSLNLGVIAEGVELEHQKEFLLSENCQEMQGYLFSKPVPYEEFERLIQLKNA